MTRISPTLDSRPAPQVAKRLVHDAVHRYRPLSREGLSERLFTLAFSGLVYPQIWEDPAVDLAEDGASKLARRPDATIPDFIGGSYADILRLYLESAQTPSLKDPRVSPAYFADEKAFPGNFLMIGAEHDMFCFEGEAMAGRLAGMIGGVREKAEMGWRAGGVRWVEVMGQPHAFDAFPAKAPVTEASRVAAVGVMYGLLAEWLVGVFTADDSG